MQQDIFASLEKIHFLSKQNEDSIRVLAEKTKEVKFKRKSIIIHEGDDTNSLYIILSGKVRVYCSDENSKDVTLIIQEAGTSFGILSTLSEDIPRSATVEALESTVCGVINKNDFLNWLRVHPDVAIALLAEFADKIRFLTDKVKQLALSNAYERTVKTLMDLAVQEEGSDEYIIHNKPTQESLANMVGVSRETVCKFMHGLTEGGYLVKKGKTLRIVKKLPARF